MLRFFLACLLVTQSLYAGANETISLPDMGDSSGAVLSKQDENRLGASLLRWLRQNDLVVNDPIVQSYIHSLGYHLVANSDETSQPYTFFVVRDKSINAFAAPGGYIGVHTGLILTTQNEHELAAVLAHEIAHITQKHLNRTYENARKHQLTTAVALLAAILVGQNVEQLAEAAIATTVAANAQLHINFTRAHEKEADYIGIKTLANAGFDPNGMPAFFERMQKASRLHGHELPEFLSTHPVSVNRIADSRNRARSMRVSAASHDRLYAFVRARLRVQKAENLSQFIADYTQSKQRTSNNDIYHYTLAIAKLRANQAAEAKKHIIGLVKKSPENMLYRITQARIQQALGQHDKASKNFSALLRLYPYNNAVTVYYAQQLLQTNKSKMAYKLLQDYARNRNPDGQILKLLSDASSQNGKTAEAYFYLAEHEYINGNTRPAISHLNTALKIKNLDYYLSSKIEARLKTYKQMALLEKKQ